MRDSSSSSTRADGPAIQLPGCGTSAATCWSARPAGHRWPTATPRGSTSRAVTTRPRDQVLDRESIGDLRAALGRISGPQRRLLLLIASGMTPLEVGALLGASGGAVRTRLHRARRLLLSELEAHGRIA